MELLDPRKNDVILDVGAGTGYISSKVAKLCDDVYALEVDDKRVDFIKAKYPEVKALSGSSENIPFPESYFDKVFIVAALHHFRDQEESLIELARVMKSGGLLLVQEFDPSPRSKNVFTKEKIEAKIARVSFLSLDELKEKLEIDGFSVEAERRVRKGYFVTARKTG